jgi:hypothetical protein
MGLSHSICSQIQTVPIRTCCLCLLYRGKGHAHIIKSTGSRLGKRLLSKGISQNPFLTDDLAGDRYKKNLPSLKDNSLSCIRYVCQYCFPKKQNYSSSSVSSLSRTRTHAPTVKDTAAQGYPLCHTIVCLLIFNKSLGCKIP